MSFNVHSNLEGRHAFLSPSTYNWINYDDDKLEDKIINQFAAVRGSQMHDLAHMLIKLKQKLPDTTATLNQYVNDAIGFGMTPEQALFYSENCFGRADAILFRDGVLRIHDLKTGVIPGHVEQLEVYAALFCLEYHYKPQDIKMMLRIYQNDELLEWDADPMQIALIMQKIIHFDKIIKQRRMEAFA